MPRFKKKCPFSDSLLGSGKTTLLKRILSFSADLSRTVVLVNEFMKFLSRQPLELFRIKGQVKFTDETKILNNVGTKSDWQQWPDNGGTCLVFIGWGVIEEQIVSQLNACLVCA